MKCPICNSILSPFSSGGQTIDVCDECHGIWFDPIELGIVAEQMVEEGSIDDQEAHNAFELTSKSSDGDTREKMCPRCEVITNTFNYAYDSNVFLNKCMKCGGVWTDGGELHRVAQYLKGNPVINRYAESLMDEMVKGREEGFFSRLLKSRFLSGLVALIYLGSAFAIGNTENILNMTMLLVLPLACIWYSGEMGKSRGFLFCYPAVTKESPGIFVALAGWMLLLSPVVILILSILSDQ